MVMFHAAHPKLPGGRVLHLAFDRRRHPEVPQTPGAWDDLVVFRPTPLKNDGVKVSWDYSQY